MKVRFKATGAIRNLPAFRVRALLRAGVVELAGAPETPAVTEPARLEDAAAIFGGAPIPAAPQPAEDKPRRGRPRKNRS